MRLTDVRLLVTDFGACLAFYRDTIGLDIRLEVADVYAEFDGRPTTLSIFGRRDMATVVGASDRPADADAQDRAALIFAVDDVDAAVAALRDRGAAFVTEPHDQETWGIRVAHLRDPDQNLIELYHPIVDGG